MDILAVRGTELRYLLIRTRVTPGKEYARIWDVKKDVWSPEKYYLEFIKFGYWNDPPEHLVAKYRSQPLPKEFRDGSLA